MPKCMVHHWHHSSLFWSHPFLSFSRRPWVCKQLLDDAWEKKALHSMCSLALLWRLTSIARGFSKGLITVVFSRISWRSITHATAMASVWRTVVCAPSSQAMMLLIALCLNKTQRNQTMTCDFWDLLSDCVCCWQSCHCLRSGLDINIAGSNLGESSLHITHQCCIFCPLPFCPPCGLVLILRPSVCWLLLDQPEKKEIRWRVLQDTPTILREHVIQEVQGTCPDYRKCHGISRRTSAAGAR